MLTFYVFWTSSSACARYHYVCAPKEFALVNSCEVLAIRLHCSQCHQLSSTDSLASSLPAAIYTSTDDPANNKWLCYTINDSQIETSHCHMSTPNMKRLCPCVA